MFVSRVPAFQNCDLEPLRANRQVDVFNHTPRLTVFCLRSQALTATFSEPGAVCFTTAEEALLTASRRRIDHHGSVYQSQLSGSVSLVYQKLEGAPIGLHFTLPHDYPDCAPRIQVQCAAGRYTQTCMDVPIPGCRVWMFPFLAVECH